MSNPIKNFDEFIVESANLFGDMNTYIERFKHVPDFKTGEILPTVSGTPNEFPEIDSKGDWKTDGWNYTSIRTYTQKDFKNPREVLNLFIDKVIGPNKREWTATNLRKPNAIFDFNKKDLTVAFQHPALGLIFFYCWDSSTDRSRSSDYTYQVQGMFMNAERSNGAIDKYPQLKQGIDDAMSKGRFDDAAIKAAIDYLRNKYASRGF